MHTHRIRPGETLTMVARANRTTVDRLVAANGLRNPNVVPAGTVLRLPDHFEPARTGPGAVRPSTTPTSQPSRGVTVDQLRRIMPRLALADARRYLPFLNTAMAEVNITTPKRQAAFLAQVSHESGQLRFFEEIASGAAYEGRRDLGNVRPGDGRRFKGRGPIQLTGRATYRAAGRAPGLDLENRPTRAADPDVGFRVAGWYWKTRDLNALADRGDFVEITRRINGGLNGLADRQQAWARARAVLQA
ncbi:MAG: glycoside hydrolase family 19 protein [Myxococcaceae bacterium]|nr:glycoside hydrolase family 19 protein [Myxococcaceae bacterium]